MNKLTVILLLALTPLVGQVGYETGTYAVRDSKIVLRKGSVIVWVEYVTEVIMDGEPVTVITGERVDFRTKAEARQWMRDQKDNESIMYMKLLTVRDDKERRPYTFADDLHRQD